MDGCGEAGEAQGILQGSFDENFSATSWESCATSSQLRSNFVTSMGPILSQPNSNLNFSIRFRFEINLIITDLNI